MAQNDDQKKDDTPEVDHTDAVDAEIVTDDAEPLAAAASEGGDDAGEETPEAAPQPGETGGASNSLVGPFAIIIGALVVVAALIIVLNRNNDAQTRADANEFDAAEPAIVSRPIDRTKMAAADTEEEVTRNNVAASEGDETVAAPVEVIAAEQDDAEGEPADTAAAPQNALLARAEERAADVLAEEETAIVETATDEAEEIAEEASVAAEKIAAMVDGTSTSVETTPDAGEDAAPQTDAASAPTANEVAAILDDTSGDDVTAATDAAVIEAEEEIATQANETVASNDTVTDMETPIADAVEAAAEDPLAAAAPVVMAVENAADDVASSDETVPSVPETMATAHETLEGTADEAAAIIADTSEEQPAIVNAPETAPEEVTPADTDTIQLAEENSRQEDNTPPPADSDAIEARIDDITSTVKQDVLAETEQAISQAIGKTEAQVEELRTQLTEQTELQREANEQLASLSSKIETIETSDLSTTRHSTLLLALGDLSEGIDSGRPFGRELDTVENLTPNARELTALHKYSDAGLPTTTELQQAYQEAARNALSGAKRAEADGAMGRFAANLSGLFTVRKIGDVEGDSLSAIIARAEARLESDDLPSALQELEQLDGPGRAAFQEWIDAASAKVDAHRRINALEKSIAASRAG